MFVTVRNRDLRRQLEKTSCWISSAHFLLQYLAVDIGLLALHARYYHSDPDSVLAMSGAGNPSVILNDYGFDQGYKAETLRVSTSEKSEVIAAIADSLRANLPVIARIKSDNILGFGHALIITGIDTGSGTVIFKDPGTGTKSRSFSVDVRHVSYDQFFSSGFKYGHSNSMYLDVMGKCTHVIYLTRYEIGSLFD